MKSTRDTSLDKMKRKATDKPKLSAQEGFNALFKKKKKEVKIEATIDLCDSDEENQPVNSKPSNSEPQKAQSSKPAFKLEPPKSTQKPEKDENNETEVKIETQETEEEKTNSTAMVTVVRLLLSIVLKGSGQLIFCYWVALEFAALKSKLQVSL